MAEDENNIEDQWIYDQHTSGDTFYNDIDSNIIDSAEKFETDHIIQNRTCTSSRKLYSFISSHNFIKDKSESDFNIIDQGYKKKYNIPDNHIKEFFTLLDKCRKDYSMVHYSERQNNHSGIMIDIDRYQRSSIRDINTRHFDKFARYLSLRLCEVIDFSAQGDEVKFHMFVIQKPEVVPADRKEYEGSYKDGFHILLPEIQIRKEVKKYLFKSMFESGDMKKIFADVDNMEDPNNMLDLMAASNVVLFYGNSKRDKPAYKLVYALEITLDVELKVPTTTVIPIEKLNDKSKKNLASEYNLTYELSLSFYFPDINNKSTWLKKIKYEHLKEIDDKIQISNERDNKGDVFYDAEDSLSILTLNDPDAAFMQKILMLLDIDYATDYNKWFSVICALANTDKTYKSLALWFSQRNPDKFDMTTFEKIWTSACDTTNKKTADPLTKRSILHWARKSNPQKYKELTTTSYYSMLRIYALKYEGDIRHAMVAKVVHRMLSDGFIVDVEEGASKEITYWFEFVTPGRKMRKGEVYKWRKQITPETIYKYISEHLPKIYMQILEMIRGNKNDAESRDLTKYWKRVEDKFKQSMSHLHDHGFQKSVVKQAGMWFRQRGFLEELDKEQDIIGVGNGVLKLGIEPQLIKDFHEYKISKFTEVDYMPYDPQNPYIQLVEQAFRDVFIEQEVCEWMWYYFSLGLDGRIVQPILLFLYGGGCNGKTFILELISNALGDQYATKIPIQLLTDQREKASQANSAFVDMADRRFVYASEPNKSEILNTARIKEIVSPEKQTGRGVYEVKQKKFEITANLTCGSNYKFTINCTDHGIWRRVRFYCNKVKFCQNPDPKNKYEKKDNPNYAHNYIKDPMVLQATISILTHYNSILRQKYDYNIKNVPCKTIEYETEKYRNEQDSVNSFVCQMLVKSPENSAEYSISMLASHYIQWYNQTRQPMSHDTQDIIAQLENSRISNGFSRAANGALILKGFRLLDISNPEITDGEERIMPKMPELSDGFELPKESNELKPDGMTPAILSDDSDDSNQERKDEAERTKGKNNGANEEKKKDSLDKFLKDN